MSGGPNPRDLHGEARALAKRGDFATAAPLLCELLHRTPIVPGAINDLATCCAGLGRLEEAFRLYFIAERLSHAFALEGLPIDSIHRSLTILKAMLGDERVETIVADFGSALGLDAATGTFTSKARASSVEELIHALVRSTVADVRAKLL